MWRNNAGIRKIRKPQPNHFADAVPLILDIVAATLTNFVRDVALDSSWNQVKAGGRTQNQEYRVARKVWDTELINVNCIVRLILCELQNIWLKLIKSPNFIKAFVPYTKLVWRPCSSYTINHESFYTMSREYWYFVCTSRIFDMRFI